MTDNSMEQIIIYTDGACIANPGPGGWSAIIGNQESYIELHGGESHTTNNRMELLAAIRGLESLSTPSDVILHSDSQYLVNAFNKGWLNNWIRNQWRNSSGPVKNKDLWKELYLLCRTHSVQFVWVKGHAGNPWNERCDQLARMEAETYFKNS